MVAERIPVTKALVARPGALYSQGSRVTPPQRRTSQAQRFRISSTHRMIEAIAPRMPHCTKVSGVVPKATCRNGTSTTRTLQHEPDQGRPHHTPARSKDGAMAGNAPRGAR